MDIVNINIEIPEDLHKKVKIACALNGISMKGFYV